MTPSRRNFLVFVAFAIALVVVLVETGTELFGGDPTQAYPVEDPVGHGIGHLLWIDGLLAFALLLNALNYVVRDALHVKLQGIISLVVSALLVLGAFFALLVAVATLVVMVMLFLAAPFGTIAYLARWGSFPTGPAAATLGAIFGLKIAWIVVLLIANPNFVRNKMLVSLTLTSVLATALTSFLHGFPPSMLVSITDLIAAIVSTILGLIWGIVMFVGSLVAVVKLLLRTATSRVEAVG